MKRYKLLIIIPIVILIIDSCCKPKTYSYSEIIPNKYKEWLNFEENSWWVYKLYTLTNIYDEYDHLSGVDTQVQVLDTIFLYKKEFTVDTLSSSLFSSPKFCKLDESVRTVEDIKLYFIYKEKPMKLGLYYKEFNDMMSPNMNYYYGRVLILNNYFFEIENAQLFNDFVLFRTDTEESDNQQDYYNTIFNNLDTFTVEGTLYNNVLENNFDEESPAAGSTLNPSIWLTKEDWIIKLIYKKYDADNTTYILTLVDKNIIK
jgi:hypothetical protein